MVLQAPLLENILQLEVDTIFWWQKVIEAKYCSACEIKIVMHFSLALAAGSKKLFVEENCLEVMGQAFMVREWESKIAAANFSRRG